LSAFDPWLRGFTRSRRPTFSVGEAMNNTEKFEDHHEGWRTLWLAVAGVMAITLTWNVLMLSLNGISY
jgi:LPS sulfotransferase NodH